MMQPTSRLRFVKRTEMKIVETCTDGSEICKSVERMILQQQWVDDAKTVHGFKEFYYKEWRDVPVENE